MPLERKPSRELVGKLIVTKEGRKLGIVRDITFEARSGELIQLIMGAPTAYASSLGLEKTDSDLLVPYSAILAIGDFIVVSEEDLR